MNISDGGRQNWGSGGGSQGKYGGMTSDSY